MSTKRRKLDYCAHCGRHKQYHCHFKAIDMPVGCECDHLDWSDIYKIPDVCGSYTETPEVTKDLGEGVCGICEHLKECHKNSESKDGD